MAPIVALVALWSTTTLNDNLNSSLVPTLSAFSALRYYKKLSILFINRFVISPFYVKLVASVYKSSRSKSFKIVCPLCGEETVCCTKDNNSGGNGGGVQGLPLNVFALKMSQEKAKV